MRDPSFFGKIFIATEPVDFRKHAAGLAVIAEHRLELNVLSDRNLFVFTNKRRSAVKCLYWDRTGYALWWKTLEKDVFRWPRKGENGICKLSPKELSWLLEGVDPTSLKKHKKINIQ